MAECKFCGHVGDFDSIPICDDCLAIDVEAVDEEMNEEIKAMKSLCIVADVYKDLRKLLEETK